jgi:hypothetical protein
MKSVIFETNYYPSDYDKDVFLYLVFNNQAHISTISLDGSILFMGQLKKKLRLGLGKELKNKSLFVQTHITDIRDDTDLTEVTYILSNQDKEDKTTLNKTVDQDKGTIYYEARFNFK